MSKILLGLFVGILGMAALAAAQSVSVVNWVSTYVDTITPILHKQMWWGDRRDIVQRYCWSVGDMIIQEDNSLYDARQSLFVQMLCSSVPDIERTTPALTWSEEEGDYLNLDNWSRLGIDNRWCDPRYGMMQCPLDIQLYDLMQRLLDEYFLIHQASVYGRGLGGSGSVRDIASLISRDILLGIDVCDTSVSNEMDTCDLLVDTYRRANRISREVDIVDIQILADLKQKNHEGISNKFCGLQFSPDRDIIYCGLMGSAIGASSVSFVDLVYNELFYYRLFMAYYISLLRHYDTYFLDSDNISVERVRVVDRGMQYIYDVQQASELAIQASRDIYMVYPLHVWLSWYYELLYVMRWQLAKVVTPLYTLYDKLRNVQAKE